MRSCIGVIGAAVLATACSTKSLQSIDATGSGSIDAGGDREPPRDAADDAPASIDVFSFEVRILDAPPGDAPPDFANDAPPFPGIRSFAVTSQVQRDGGVGTFPSSHVFTIVLDGDRRTAITGGAGEGTASTFEVLASGELHIIGSLRFAVSGGCGAPSITYDDLRVTIDTNGRLTGTGRGQVLSVSGDIAYSAPATMSLYGLLDIQPPTLTITGDATDPFASFAVVPSEPLPPGVTATLRSAGGEAVGLTAGGTVGNFVTVFQKPAMVLRYATQYNIVATGIADFAGNAATGVGSLTFTTRQLPPLAAEDGFESVADGTFAGVQLLSGAGAPTISGAKSLYIPPANIGAGLMQPSLALRLQLAGGDTVVRFSYRTVMASSGVNFAYGVGFALGSEGATPSAPLLPPDPATTTTPATIGGAQVSLGPLTTATFALPADAAGEVILTRTYRPPINCGGPVPPVAGLIIDELRAE